jgi:hypothetical protein
MSYRILGLVGFFAGATVAAALGGPPPSTVVTKHGDLRNFRAEARKIPRKGAARPKSAQGFSPFVYLLPCQIPRA